MKAGDKFVQAAVDIAKILGISELVIGATIVSLGTALPEILVSCTAAVGGFSDVAFGNAAGSIICNTAFIAGLTQLLRPTPVPDRSALMWRSFFFFAAGAIVLIFGLGMGFYDRRAGLVLLGLFALYVFLNMKSGMKGGSSGNASPEQQTLPKEGLPKSILILVLCAFFLFIGARLLVDNGILIARALGVPERVIGVTFIALGTSLPELVTAIASIMRGHTAVSVGNILGANLLNLLLVIGIPATFGVLSPSPSAISVDLPIALSLMAFLILPMLLRKKGYRWQGAVLVLSYIIYCVAQFTA